MVISDPHTCAKCKRRNPINYHVEPETAWRTVVLNRWKQLCPSASTCSRSKLA
jgi:hypothetical protein